jgi:protein SCO1/2
MMEHFEVRRSSPLWRILRASFVAVLFLSLGTPLIRSAPERRLPVIQKAPGFDLIDQNGKKTSMAAFKGKVLLVSFIFTTCSGSCPATTHRLARVQEELHKRGLVAKGVHLVSISVDPARDTPEVLKGYMRLYDIDPATWTFLTGSSAKVADTLAAWGMWAKPAANGQLDHPSRIFLIDRRGRVREIYNLDFLRTPWVMEDIEALLREE